MTEMKKSIFLAALLIAIGASASDSYLYWMVNTADTTPDYSGYSYARIKAVDGGTEKYLTIYEGDFEDPLLVNGESGVSRDIVNLYHDFDANAGFYASLAGVSSSASFIVELFNDSGKFLAQSFNDGAYGTLSAYIYAGGISGQSPVSPWLAGSFDVPEPSSGLLMLLGMAGLALRRRKV